MSDKHVLNASYTALSIWHPGLIDKAKKVRFLHPKLTVTIILDYFLLSFDHMFFRATSQSLRTLWPWPTAAIFLSIFWNAEGFSARNQHRYIRENFLNHAEFHELAQYSPRWGFYGSGNLELGHHFDTAPNALSPGFGENLAKQIFQMYRGMLEHGSLTKDQTFTVEEYGGGNGILAHDVLTSIERNALTSSDQLWSTLWNNLKYRLGEKAQHLRKLQVGKNQRFIDTGILSVQSCDATQISPHGQEKEELRGIVLSNELLDAFPGHIFRFSTQASPKMIHYIPTFNLSSIQHLFKETRINIEEIQAESKSHFAQLADIQELSQVPNGNAVVSAKTFDEMYAALASPEERDKLSESLHLLKYWIPLRETDSEYRHISQYVEKIQQRLTENQLLDLTVSPGFEAFYRQISERFGAGYVLSIDGYVSIDSQLSRFWPSQRVQVILTRDNGQPTEMPAHRTQLIGPAISVYGAGDRSNVLPTEYPGSLDLFNTPLFDSVRSEGRRFGMETVLFKPVDSVLLLTDKQKETASQLHLFRQILRSLPSEDEHVYGSVSRVRALELMLHVYFPDTFAGPRNETETLAYEEISAATPPQLPDSHIETLTSHNYRMNDFLKIHHIVVQQITGTDPSFVERVTISE